MSFFATITQETEWRTINKNRVENSEQGDEEDFEVPYCALATVLSTLSQEQARTLESCYCGAFPTFKVPLQIALYHSFVMEGADLETGGNVTEKLFSTETPLDLAMSKDRDSFVSHLQMIENSTEEVLSQSDSLFRQLKLKEGLSTMRQSPVLIYDDEFHVMTHTCPADELALAWDNLSQLVAEYNEFPFLQTVLLHFGFVHIHPYEDGNGRVGRSLVLAQQQNARHFPLIITTPQRQQYTYLLSHTRRFQDIQPLVQFCAYCQNSWSTRFTGTPKLLCTEQELIKSLHDKAFHQSDYREYSNPTETPPLHVELDATVPLLYEGQLLFSCEWSVQASHLSSALTYVGCNVVKVGGLIAAVGLCQVRIRSHIGTSHVVTPIPFVPLVGVNFEDWWKYFSHNMQLWLEENRK
eukprot:TRINITY_DN67842_c6_g5_i1.p1 TRINITY_DN67842_c6_g5~~TRINITY_DN67842_c6_g5_i1.p1  ORF type:complete len:410 (+),score=21.09 TRINITY_DN67842_c6_g5_i1:35-1264(+)